MTDAPARRHGRSARFGLVSLALVGTLAVAGCGQEGKYQADDPRSAVNQLLLAAVGQGNGQRACSLMTVEARAKMDATVAGTCRAAMSNAISTLPGKYSATEHTGRGADDLDFKVVRQGDDRAQVTAWRGSSARLTFGVVRLTEDEVAADIAGTDQAVGSTGDSDWRVATGIDQLLTVSGVSDSEDTKPTTTTGN